MSNKKLKIEFPVILYRHDQMAIDYLIGLRSGDIGDYAIPSEYFYADAFNRSGLGTFVSVHSKPRSSQEVILDNDSISFFPFDYRSGGPFYGVRHKRCTSFVLNPYI